MSRPGMRFVPIKSREEQAALMLLKVRDLLTKQSTMLSDAIRGHAAEFGVTGATRWRSVGPRIGTTRGIQRCSDITFMFGTRSA